MKSRDYQSFIYVYQQLIDIAYYFTTEAKFVSQIDLFDLDPVTAQIFENIRPLAVEIEPHAKQLWCYLGKQNAR